jgi:hypothetical protein
VLAVPVLIAGFYMLITDRTAQTAFYSNTLGGSSYLYENLFWFFGHPEVYILALPGFGVVSEILPVFARKPLFGYKVGAAGMFGVALLSFFVWQHHLFDSGINPDMRPLYMLTTELISIPTGFIYLVALGTLWKAKIRFSVPMLFALGMYFNFLIGGVSGVFLSDVPADTTEHGSFFVMAYRHLPGLPDGRPGGDDLAGNPAHEGPGLPGHPLRGAATDLHRGVRRPAVPGQPERLHRHMELHGGRRAGVLGAVLPALRERGGSSGEPCQPTGGRNRQ